MFYTTHYAKGNNWLLVELIHFWLRFVSVRRTGNGRCRCCWGNPRTQTSSFLCGTREWTLPTDSTSCPSSPPPTPSRILHSTSRAPHWMSCWPNLKMVNVICDYCCCNYCVVITVTVTTIAVTTVTVTAATVTTVAVTAYCNYFGKYLTKYLTELIVIVP